jgi:glycosyltransferase 2 family protein
MKRTLWATVRLLGGAAILAALVWRVGTGPFLDGIRTIDARSLAAAAGIAVITTVCCAWRWTLVARGMGLDVAIGPAIGAYYRSTFLNTVLPGGVLGDVHRGVSHGRDVGDVGKGVRAVAWERFAGQMVQVVLAILVLAVMPSSVRSTLPIVVTVVSVVALVCVLLAYVLPKSGPSRWARTLRAAGADVRQGLLAGHTWIGIVLLSAVVVAGHAAMFLIAARTAGVTASPARMLPIALLVMLAMGLPTNIGGWGPREGVAAWAFAAAGLGAANGVATAVVYGVMSVVAGLPGAGVLVGVWLHRHNAVSEGVVRG